MGDRNREVLSPLSQITELFNLTGKTALVVGGGKVPQAIAALLRAAGATLSHAAEPPLTQGGRC